MKYFLTLLLLNVCVPLIAQHQIGQLSTSFTTNTNRNVTCEIFYPSQTAGNGALIANGAFPVIVFGHGFLMTHQNYLSYVDSLTPKGFIICFATTEESFSPNHAQFGEDLRFLVQSIQNENTNTTSPFYQHLNSKTAIIGHSMGGGAAFLAAENNTQIDAVITLAAAETTPSAINVTSNISVPTLIFSGESDCVASPDEHQNPMYQNLNSLCKTQITIKDGGHCFFGENSVTCSLGEIACNITIQEEDQKRITFKYLNAWLNQILQISSPNLTDFNAQLQMDNKITSRQSCQTLDINSVHKKPITVSPNPAKNHLKINGLEQPYTYQIINSKGVLISQPNTIAKNVIDISNLASGLYILQFIDQPNVTPIKFLKTN